MPAESVQSNHKIRNEGGYGLSILWEWFIDEPNGAKKLGEEPVADCELRERERSGRAVSRRRL